MGFAGLYPTYMAPEAGGYTVPENFLGVRAHLFFMTGIQEEGNKRPGCKAHEAGNRLTNDAVNNLEPPAFAGADAIGFLSLELPFNAHVTFYSLAVDQLRHMISAGVNTFAATDTCLLIHYGHAEKMHLHGAGGTDTDTGKVLAGGTVDKFVQTFAKGTHGNAVVFFPAGRYTDRTPSTRFPVLLYMHCHWTLTYLFLWLTPHGRAC